MVQGKRQQAGRSGHYCVRTEIDGHVTEIGSGIDLSEETAFAEQYHASHGRKVWIWDVRTGQTVYRIAREARAAGAR